MPFAPAPLRRHTKAGSQQAGYALVLMLALLVLGSLYTLLNRLNADRMRIAQTNATAHVLTQARDALIGYAATYRESHPDQGFGYLPCPDSNGDGIADSTCNNTVTVGLLPYQTLGLPDLRDASGTCLWYAVSAQFANNPKTDPMNWDGQGGITITDASGITILQQPNDAAGGVAAIIFAAGAPLNDQGNGRTSSNYPCGISPSQAALYLETVSSPFRQGPGLDAAGNTVLNDELLWITSTNLFARIRARTDFSTYVNAGIQGIASALSFSLPAASVNSASPGDGAIMLPTVAPNSLSGSDQRFYLQWRDQFRYLTCPTAGTYCFQLGNQICDGVLLFGGENSTGLPRPTTARALTNYFESPALDLVSGATHALATPSSQYATTTLATRSQDLALCLSPQTQTIDANTPAPTVVSSTTTDANGSSSTYASYVASTNSPTLQFGQTGNNAAAYGCLWYPQPYQLGASSTPVYLRAYFAFTINTIGQGFTFTLADADTSTNPSVNMCGDTGPALGYAGDNGITANIDYPKLGLEIDTHKDTSYGDADGSHLALIYWGSNASVNDDNTHGAGNNPASGTTSYAAYPLTAGTTYYARLEMTRTYNANPLNPTLDTGQQSLLVYITANPCSQFSNLKSALSSFPSSNPACPSPLLSGSITLQRVADGPAPMKQIWVGFTSGQGTPGQSIQIQAFNLQISQ